MKAVLLSVKSKWVDLILRGEKTIEIRKTIPKCSFPVDVYIYCTKDNKEYEHCGKVCTKFTLKEFDIMSLEAMFINVQYTLNEAKIEWHDLRRYFGNRDYVFKWKIEDLEKVEYKLEDFGIVKAPQSYCYVELKKGEKNEIK